MNQSAGSARFHFSIAFLEPRFIQAQTLFSFNSHIIAVRGFHYYNTKAREKQVGGIFYKSLDSQARL